jgi:hypothetical protein
MPLLKISQVFFSTAAWREGRTCACVTQQTSDSDKPQIRARSFAISWNNAFHECVVIANHN